MGFSEPEMLMMTPRKFFKLFEEYQLMAGIKKEPAGIDDLP